MVSEPFRDGDAGAGQPPVSGVDAAAAITSEPWEQWYQANGPTDPSHRMPGHTSRWRRAAAVVTGAAAVLAVFSAGVLYGDLSSRHDTAAAATATQHVLPPRAAPSPQPTAAIVVQAPSNVPVLTQPAGAVPGAPPVRISIPALKIDQRLIGLQVNANRQLEVPRNYNDIGWWSTGPLPGDPGAAVIVGHLDSKVGPAVFYRLWSLTKGDTVAVRRADGTTVRFVVTQRQLFSKQHFPDKLVYRTTGRASLHLITCGGSYDRATGYRDNVVVFADLVKPRPVTRPNPHRKPRAAVTRRPATRTPPAKVRQRVSPKATSPSNRPHGKTPRGR